MPASLALLVLGPLVGNELAIAVFVHPQLFRLPDAAHALAARALARTLGRAMPPWYAGALGLCLLLAWRAVPGTAARTGAAVAAALMAMSILLTLSRLLPINRHVAAWDVTALPPNWREERRRWDRLHRLRVGMLGGALVALVAGA